MSVGAAVSMIEKLVNTKIGDALTFSATVTALSGGQVQIKRLGATTPESKLYAKLAGWGLTVGDEVICVNFLGAAFVLGRVQRAAPSTIDVDGKLLVSALDPSTGTDGQVVTRVSGAMALATPNNYFNLESSSSTVTNSTNASTSTPIEAWHVDFTLPAGAWTVRVVVSVLATHSANGQAYCQPSLDGSAISSRGSAVNSSSPSRVANSGSYTSIASGAHTAYVNFRPNTAGTMTVTNPQILVDAWRTA